MAVDSSHRYSNDGFYKIIQQCQGLSVVRTEPCDADGAEARSPSGVRLGITIDPQKHGGAGGEVKQAWISYESVELSIHSDCQLVCPHCQLNITFLHGVFGGL